MSSACYLFQSSLDHSEQAEFAELETAALEGAELQRADQYINEADRRRFTIGRALARLAASELLQIPIDEAGIEISDTGKPKLREAHNEKLDFSISHSADNVLVSGSISGKTGVDVEVLPKNSPLEELRELVFSQSEISQHSAQSSSSDAVIHAFSAKEAILKMHGVGLAGGMPEITLPREIPIQGQGWAQIATPWGAAYLAQLIMPDDYCAYLSVSNLPSHICRRFVSVPHLSGAFKAAALTKSRGVDRPH